jgi:hypothetical protein
MATALDPAAAEAEVEAAAPAPAAAEAEATAPAPATAPEANVSTVGLTLLLDVGPQANDRLLIEMGGLL